MKHFLYVFSENERDSLIELGYTLIKSDKDKHIYVFENQAKLHFNHNQIKAIPSDTLTY